MLIINDSLSYSYMNKSFFNGLYVSIFGHEKTTPNKEAHKRIKKIYVLVIVLKGKGYFTFNNITYHLGENDIFLIPPLEEYSYEPDKNDPWEYIWFNFIGDKSKPLCDNALLTSVSPVYHCPDRSIITDMLPLFSEGMNEYLETVYSASVLVEFFAKITQLRNPLLKFRTSSSELIVDAAQEYINRSYTDPELSLDTLADILNVNPSYLSRIFKEINGFNITYYLNSVRIQNARRLLVNTKKSVDEISKLTGYTNRHYFTTQFKNHTYMTPTYYREYYGKISKNE